MRDFFFQHWKVNGKRLFITNACSSVFWKWDLQNTNSLYPLHMIRSSSVFHFLVFSYWGISFIISHLFVLKIPSERKHPKVLILSFFGSSNACFTASSSLCFLLIWRDNAAWYWSQYGQRLFGLGFDLATCCDKAKDKKWNG